MKKAGTAGSAFAVRPIDWIEHPVGVVALIERLRLADREGGVALLDRALAVAGVRAALVGIGVARATVAVGVGVGLAFEGESVRRGRSQHEGGGQDGQAKARRRQMLHDGLTVVRSRIEARTIWP